MKKLLLALVAILTVALPGLAKTLYVNFEPVKGWWSTAYIYAKDNGENASWPGVQGTKISDYIFKFVVDDKYPTILFNNGNSGGGNQTGDLKNLVDGHLYELTDGGYDKNVNSTDKGTYTEPVQIVAYDLYGSGWGNNGWGNKTLINNNGKWEIKDLELSNGDKFGIRGLDSSNTQKQWYWGESNKNTFTAQAR